MDRLQSELQRLFLPHGAKAGEVRAIALALARPASWEVLKKVWQGVQGDLALPAPAIAVSGVDALQLWFSFAQPMPATQATAFIDALRRRYLADVAPDRVRVEAVAAPPPVEFAPGRWSAFVAPDLAALFVDEPWLDMPPGGDAQADTLSRIACAAAGDVQRALDGLQADSTPAQPSSPPAGPRAFLLAAMNDRALDMRLRIEAAKALLPHFRDPGDRG